MDANFSPAAVSVPKDAVLSCAGREGGGIAVLAGRVWLTQPNDVRDHVLEAGESFAFEGRGPVVVQALRDARVLPLGKKALDATRARPIRRLLREPEFFYGFIGLALAWQIVFLFDAAA